MKKFGLLVIAACLLPLDLAYAASVEDDIAERIKKVGEVCIQGSDCTPASAGSMTVASASTGGPEQANYKKSCATCHALGIADAPKLGDTTAWEPRIAKGMDVLYQSAINGLPPAMPAKGLCFTCSDDDLKAVVDYMVKSVR